MSGWIVGKCSQGLLVGAKNRKKIGSHFGLEELRLNSEVEIWGEKINSQTPVSSNFRIQDFEWIFPTY